MTRTHVFLTTSTGTPEMSAASPGVWVSETRCCSGLGWAGVALGGGTSASTPCATSGCSSSRMSLLSSMPMSLQHHACGTHKYGTHAPCAQYTQVWNTSTMRTVYALEAKACAHVGQAVGRAQRGKRKASSHPLAMMSLTS